MEPDPIGLAGGLNPYAYALNNPVMYVDMTGENPILIAMGVRPSWSGLYVGQTVIGSVYDAYTINTGFEGITSNLSKLVLN